jgi:hypothetical protein
VVVAADKEVLRMPYVKGIRRLAAAVFTSALIVGAVPAVAAASCPVQTSTTALAKFGDNASYYLLTGSSFEGGASGWSLDNAEVVSEENATGGSQAVMIAPNGSATSPEFCVSSEYPTFRFFAHSVGRTGFFGSSLTASLRWTDADGFDHDVTVATLQRSRGWVLTPVLQLASALPLWMPNATLKVRLVLEAGWSARWAVAGVYIDPYSR